MDPEPGPLGARPPWELLLGLVLVLGVLGFASVDWWRTEQAAQAYQQGQAAVTVRHWDAARQDFAAAGDRLSPWSRLAPYG